MKLTLPTKPAIPPPPATGTPSDLDGKAQEFGETTAREPFGVYVHFPWCLNKCPYCDFLSVAEQPENIPHRAYADAVLAELERRREWVGERPLKSVFFGGGTPSLWESEEIGRVLDAIQKAFPENRDTEVTVECNPTSFDRRRGEALLAAGVNRVSLGLQGLDAGRLRFLGRLHDVAGALRALDDAIAVGFSKVSADLIVGVAGQRPEEAAKEAATLASRSLTHVSAYVLTIEPNTMFGALARKGHLPLLGEDQVADSFARVSEALVRSGFEHYEISNYARSGDYAEHNLVYWRGADYLGLGTGAWGTVSTRGARLRYRNTAVPKRYVQHAGLWAAEPLTRPSFLVQEVEALDSGTELSERILLGLRLAEGIDLDRAGRELGVNAWTPDRTSAVARLVADGMLVRNGGRLRIPGERWLMADHVIRQVM